MNRVVVAIYGSDSRRVDVVRLPDYHAICYRTATKSLHFQESECKNAIQDEKNNAA